MVLDSSTTHDTTMTSDTGITFYDIKSSEPRRTFAPNPWKTRLALNHKGLKYQTQWVDMPDITALREKLNVPANRTLPDGTAFHTLPVIHDHATGAIIGDTFEIALYLDKTYPDRPTLFKPHTTGLTALLNSQMDTLFTKHLAVVHEMVFPPESKDACYAIFAKRAGAKSYSDLQPSAEQREAVFVQFEAALDELLKGFRHTGGTTDHFWRAPGAKETTNLQRGPKKRGIWLDDGEEPAYSDFIIGAWLKCLEVNMREEDWRRIRGWNEGFWGRYVDALEKWAEIK
jgi:glutathione S-transferase